MVLSTFRTTDVRSAHLVGAISTFIFAPIYCWIQTLISYTLSPVAVPKWLANVRLTLCVIMSLSFTIAIACGIIVNIKYKTMKERLSKGELLYINSTANEWVTAIAIDLFILTFTREMYGVAITAPECRLVEEIVQVAAEVEHRSDSPTSSVATQATTDHREMHFNHTRGHGCDCKSLPPLSTVINMIGERDQARGDSTFTRASASA